MNREPVDVFVRVWSQSMFRAKMAATVIERLSYFDGPETRVLCLVHPETWGFLTPIGLLPPGWRRGDRCVDVTASADFARASRLVADDLARSPVYCLIDDDQLPLGADWVERGVTHVEQHPEYVSLSSLSINEEVAWDPDTEPEVFARGSTGTPCFVRKRTFIDLPPGPAHDYDLTLSRHLRRHGGRVGFMRDVRHNHLGRDCSQVIPEHWRV